MTKDEAVIQFQISKGMIENNGRKFGLNEYEKDLLKAIEFAIETLKRIDTKKIEHIIIDTRKANANRFHTEEAEAQEVVNYLGGECRAKKR